jgi:hypothetical protein
MKLLLGPKGSSDLGTVELKKVMFGIKHKECDALMMIIWMTIIRMTIIITITKNKNKITVTIINSDQFREVLSNLWRISKSQLQQHLQV